MARGRHRPILRPDTAHGVDQLLAGAVVEGHGEQHAGVPGGVADGLADGPLDVLRRPGLGRVERPADPLDAHVELVELLDAAEQLGVEAEDVADLGAGTDPVLGREPEHGEPADVPRHGDAHEPGQVLLALGVPLGPRQPAPPCPAAVAVHDAGDVQWHRRPRYGAAWETRGCGIVARARDGRGGHEARVAGRRRGRVAGAGLPARRRRGRRRWRLADDPRLRGG